MNEVYEYLKKCTVFYLATIDGDMPRVRPFGATDLFEGKIYIQTGNVKDVYKQMINNPNIEICAMADKGSWIRISAKAQRDDRLEAREHMLQTNPGLKGRYAADDGNCEVLFLKDATASFCSFTSEPKIVKF